ncbi:muts domain V-domain-containing protein [Aspergillus pseudonomiae]|uniref:Muts domain V-domain-containing protein n=1 Tax=Aspergillus pseudonomiae TaxID=1506151 RepID=A0A5N7D4H3_9EURO|nr:muts domain V-domain-containing protein [Aspergillus pseudonomiae]KAE8401294.1 muts domain V-domain-containing protein [Aspergillus pseudonomiae]
MKSQTKKRRTTYHSNTTSHSSHSRLSHDRGTQSSASYNPPSSSRRSPILRQPLFNDSRGYLPGSPIQQLTDDDLDQVIVAVDMRESGTVGCSYYSAQEETLYLLGDMQLAGTEILDSLVLQTKPTALLLSPRVDYLCSQDTNECGQGNSSQSYLPYQLDVRPSQEFSYLNAKNKLVALEISSEHEQRIRFLVPHNGLIDTEQMDTESLDFTLQDGRFLHIPSSIDMENQVTIGCAGAVLTHLQRRRATVMPASSDETSSYFQVRSVEMLSLQGTMFLSGRTLLELQIMESESHPSMVNQGPGKKSSSSKEGLSLYGLFQRFAYSPQGRHRLKQIFLRPSIDIDVIRERHAFIGVYLRPDNYNPLNKLTKSLKHIKNLRPVMINLRKGISTGSGKLTGFKSTVWATLLAFAFYGIDIHDALKETASGNELPLLQKALWVLEEAQLYRVDIDSTEEQGRTVVKPGLDRELDKMKDSYDGLSSLLKQVAIDIASTIPESLDIDVNVIYFPQLGFNIAIPLNDRGEATFTGSDDEWELIFVTENRAYFKDFRMREMDEKLGDIYGLICEKEIEIVYELAQKVLQYEKVLLEASDICGHIDSLLAMSQAASFYRLTRPKLVRENVISIKGGRHILQELTVSSYVPNDTLLVGGKLGACAPCSSSKPQTALETWGSQSMLLLTGPNYSGKSIYMKQATESVEMGITDKILVKSNSQDSVSQIQSTFMNDLQQISFDLKQMTERSLLIIDEFGKGTSESDGIGLICGILNHLLIAENAPKVIAATHFHEILENEFLKPGPRLLLGHMEVQVCEESCKAEDQITYLYNFHLGRSDKSYGPICAALNGINETIVERANELASLAVRGENLTAACAMLSAEEIHALEEADMLARRFLGLDLSTEGSDEATGEERDSNRGFII